MLLIPGPYLQYVKIGVALLLLLFGAAIAHRSAGAGLSAPQPPPCFTQVPSPNPSSSNTLQAVAADSTTDIWAIGSIALHWDGSSWTPFALPQVGPQQFIRGVTVLSPTNAWAVGYYAAGGGGQTVTLILHWDGAVWNTVASPNPGAYLNQLNAVKAISATDIWAVGWASNGGGVDQTVALHWNGTIWSRVPTPSPGVYLNDLQAVSALAGNDVWAVGATGDTVYQTLTLHWDGSNWNLFPSPSPGNHDILHGVSMVSPLDAWAVGEKAPNGGLPQPFILHWSGSAWTEVPAPPLGTFGNLYATSALTGTDVWAVGSYYSSTLQTAIVHWDGAAWTQVPSSSPGNSDNLNSIIALNGTTDIWAVGDYDPGTGTRLSLTLRPCPATTPTATATGTPPTATSSPSATTTGTPTSTETSTARPATGTSTVVVPSPTDTATAQPTSTPTATPTIGAFCAGVVWTDRVNTTMNGHGYLTKTSGQDGVFDAGAVSTLGITSAPACYRIDGGLVTLGAEQVFGLTHHEAAADYSDIDYGVYLGATGVLGVVEGGRLLPGNFGSYSTGDTFQIAIEGPQGNTVNFYHNGQIYYTSNIPPILPLFADASIATLEGSIPPSRACSNGPPESPTPTETACPLHFNDVQPSDYFATPVQYLACHGVVSGYADGTYHPYADTTRSQMVKIVVLGFGVPVTTPSAAGYTFHDVPPAFPFYTMIETAAAHNIVSGYICGAPGEPCDEQHRPYFHPYAAVTRGQLSKIAVGAAAWALVDPASPTFADITPGSPFYTFVETAICHGIISGYDCGGAGEPCDTNRRPYFRQANSATRGQIAKIVYGALTSQAPCPLLRR